MIIPISELREKFDAFSKPQKTLVYAIVGSFYNSEKECHQTAKSIFDVYHSDFCGLNKKTFVCDGSRYFVVDVFDSLTDEQKTIACGIIDTCRIMHNKEIEVQNNG